MLVRNFKFLEHPQWWQFLEHFWGAALGQGPELIGKLLNVHYAAVRHKMPFSRSPCNLLLPVPLSASCLKLFPWSQRWSTSLRRYKKHRHAEYFSDPWIQISFSIYSRLWHFHQCWDPQERSRGAAIRSCGISGQPGNMLLTASLGYVKWIQGKQWQVPDNTSGNN